MQSENKNDLEGMSDISHDGWNLEEIAEESVNKPSDEIKREVLRGNEAEGDADGRDVAGSADKNKTPQGHEEAKINEKRGEGNNA